MRVLLLLGLVVASTNALGGLLGGLQEVENLTEKQQEMVDFAFSQLAGSTVAGSVNCEQNKATVENFRQQVVSGMLYHFDLVLSAECAGTAKKCSMVVYDQSWTQTREVKWDKVKCDNVVEEKSEEDFPIVGGFQQVEGDLSDSDQEIVDFAFSQLAGSTVAGSVACGKSKVSVENFSSQVVAGTNYKFDLILSEECTGTAKKCNMVVFDQSWTQTREVSWDQVKCSNVVEEETRDNNPIAGGFQQVDGDLSETEQEMVDFAFSQLAGSTVAGSVNCQKNQVSVENFSSQVVAGVNYKFDLILSEQCTGTAKKCSMVVFDQSWTQTREVNWDQVTCSNVS